MCENTHRSRLELIRNRQKLAEKHNKRLKYQAFKRIPHLSQPTVYIPIY
jgi:hypothetical protein